MLLITFLILHTALAYITAMLTPRRHYSQSYAQDPTDTRIINALRILTPIHLFLCILTPQSTILTAISGFILLTLSFTLTAWAQLSNIWATPQYTKPLMISVIGPYKYIRHPIYLAALMYYTSINWIFKSPIAIPLCVAIWVLIIARAYNEERLLKRDSFIYPGYRLAVPGMFIPRRSTIHRV